MTGPKNRGWLAVTNIERFQHYKDRRPPWIKVYNALLDDYAFGCLQDASKAHLVLIWLLASRHGNRIPNDPDWIARMIHATGPVDIDGLVSAGFLTVYQGASDELADRTPPLAGREQTAMPETETEGEKEKDPISPRSSRFPARATPELSAESPGDGQERGGEIDGPEPEHPIGHQAAKETLEDMIARIRQHGPGSPTPASESDPLWPDDQRCAKVESVVRWLAPSGKAREWLLAVKAAPIERRDRIYESVMDTEGKRLSRKFDADVARKDLQAALRGTP